MSMFDEIGNKVNELSNQAVQKTKDASEIMNLKASISEEERKINDVYTQIGKVYYTKKDEAKDELNQLCQSIDASHQKITDMKKQILVLKNLVECPTCGHENPDSASFCLKCGTKLIHTVDDGKHCQNCGAPIIEGQLFCTRCGTKVQVKEETVDNTNHEEDIQVTLPDVETVDEDVKEDVVEETVPETVEAHVENVILTCPKCGKEVKAGQLFCTGCGTSLKDAKSHEEKVTIEQVPPKPAEMLCPSCHSPIKEGQKFCVVCGEKLNVEKKIAPKKVCPSCGLEIEGDKDKCDICGANLNEPAKSGDRCPKCGKEVKPGQLFCTGCGTKL